MGMSRPTGGFADEMVHSGGWPDVDEDTFYDRAQQYTRVLRGATDVLEAWGQQRAQVFDGGIWTGGAAAAADGRIGRHVDQLVSLQNAIAGVVTWHNHIGRSIMAAKTAIADNLETAHQQIDAVLSEPGLDADEQKAAVEAVIAAAHGANRGVVVSTAEQIRSTRGWAPPKYALDELLDQKLPPRITPTDSPATQPRDPQEEPAAPQPGMPGVVIPPFDSPVKDTPIRDIVTGDKPVVSLPDRDTPGTDKPGGAAPSPSPIPTVPVTPTPSQQPVTSPPASVEPPPAAVVIPPPGTKAPSAKPPESPRDDVETADLEPDAAETFPESGPSAPMGPAVTSPSAAGPDSQNRGVVAASVQSVTTQVPTVRADDGSSAVTPTATTSPGAAAAGTGAPGAARGAAPGPGTSSAAPVGKKPLNAAAPPRAASARPQQHASQPAPAERKPDAPDRVQAPDTVAVAAIPVSAARRVRDAVAEAATADAARRRGTDSLQVARRLAAALNAPENLESGESGFFWVTGVTVDGEIVVANTYGVAYIPAGVLLPDGVHMASADDAIPPADRARWVMHPVAAVQGWAAHHETTLRAVIATKEQFGGTDPGVATVVLQPDDIPDSGVMAGRPRVAVVNDEASQRLSESLDAHVLDLLPPAPPELATPADDSADDAVPSEKDAAEHTKRVADAIAAATASGDPNELLKVLKRLRESEPTPEPAPQGVADKRPTLWFEVLKPTVTAIAGREAKHLNAFGEYAAYARDYAVIQAHSAADADARRTAAADYFYWQHVASVVGTALASVGAAPR